MHKNFCFSNSKEEKFAESLYGELHPVRRSYWFLGIPPQHWEEISQ